MSVLCMSSPEDTQLIGESVDRFCLGEGGRAWSRQVAQSSAEGRRSVMRQLVEQGWHAVTVPEERGGMGLGVRALTALHRAWGTHAGPLPLLSLGVLGVGVVAAAPESELRHELLSQLLTGDLFAALAWQGQLGGMTAEATQVVATPLAQGGFLLNGCAQFVLSAALADGYVVSARLNQGIALFWIAGEMQGLTQRAVPSVEFGQMVRLDFQDLSVSANSMLAGATQGGALVDQALAMARMGAAAELLGVAEAALAMSLQHLRDRVQFGQPIGCNQALQHRAVDLFIQVNMAQAAMRRAERMAETDELRAGTLAREALVCKARCAEVAQAVTAQAIQLHGGMGYTEECDVSLYVRRAMVLAPWLGGARACRQLLAQLTPAGEML